MFASFEKQTQIRCSRRKIRDKKGAQRAWGVAAENNNYTHKPLFAGRKMKFAALINPILHANRTERAVLEGAEPHMQHRVCIA
jgi:hypothetical protein